MNRGRLEKFYYLMKLGREFELKAKEHYMLGDIAGFLHLDIGQEAVSVGTMQAFDKGDVFTHYREHVLAIARGMEPKLIMAELFGKKQVSAKVEAEVCIFLSQNLIFTEVMLL